MKKAKKYILWILSALFVIILITFHVLGIINIFNSVTMERIILAAFAISFMVCIYISEEKRLVKEKFSSLFYYTKKQQEKYRSDLEETETLLSEEQQKLDVFESINNEIIGIKCDIELGIELGTLTEDMPEYTEKVTKLEKLKKDAYDCEREFLHTKKNIEMLLQKKERQQASLYSYNDVLYFIDHL
jgi:hypothetical protein